MGANLYRSTKTVFSLGMESFPVWTPTLPSEQGACGELWRRVYRWKIFIELCVESILRFKCRHDLEVNGEKALDGRTRAITNRPSMVKR